MIDLRHIRIHLVEPVLKRLEMHSLAAERLMLGTLAHESTLAGLTALDQVLGPGDVELGPAIGIYQIEEKTRVDVFENFLAFRTELMLPVLEIEAEWPSPRRQLATNLAYATAIARLIYWRTPAPLPDADDILGLGLYWKRFYNTSQGRGDSSDWVERFNESVAGLYK